MKKNTNIYILSNQRLFKSNAGNSKYLLDIAKYLSENCGNVHLVTCSQAMFGRMPFFKLSDEMNMFTSLHYRSSIRIGNFVFCTNPVPYFGAGLFFLEKLLFKLKLIKNGFTKAAPYSISYPLTQSDKDYVKKIVSKDATTLIADYCFLTKAFPKIEGFNPQTMVIVHDIFSDRNELFKNTGKADATEIITEAEENSLLENANIIIAIQKEEGAKISARVSKNNKTIIAPLAANLIDYEYKETEEFKDSILFVGSGAVPNTDGINWFIDNVWDKIITANPNAKLFIAGNVCSKVNNLKSGIKLLGLVDSLDELYKKATIAISPLFLGSGLKIKLIEAAGYKKPMVVTSVTLQGVKEEFENSILLADDAELFAKHCVDLLKDEKLRLKYSALIGDTIQNHFSAAAVYKDLGENII